MSNVWYLYRKKCDFQGLADRLHVDPVIIRIMCNRGVPEAQMASFLHPGPADLHDPQLLSDVQKGARLLAEKIYGHVPIRIIGDYDADGVCSTCILLLGLRALGADVDYRIPERERHGYGLHEELIHLALRDGRQVLLTCDNGISEAASIAMAKEAGMTVIVTDHHNPPEVLPAADAVIDPKCPGSAYPYREICGAVVAMKFLQVLYALMGRSPDEPLKYLDIAAFATVCDVMPLRDENRYIVQEGLKRIRHTENRGLRALMAVCEVTQPKAWHFGFVLGPCVNAAGRLRTAEDAMRLLLADSDETAYDCALMLKALNDERKSMTERSVTEAFRQIEEAGDGLDRVLVLHLPDCPDSIAGIVAGRVRERLCRPVLIASGKGEVLKGSARSIPAYSLYDEMSRVKELFVKFGGHPLAAGFSIRRESLDLLRRRLNENCTLRDEDLREKKYIDADMPMSYVSVGLLEQMDLLSPFGTENPEPVFAEKQAVLLRAVRIGKEKQYLRFTVCTRSGFRTEAVYFGDASEFLGNYRAKFGETSEEHLLCGKGEEAISFVYRPQINEYRGRTSVSYRISDFIF